MRNVRLMILAVAVLTMALVSQGFCGTITITNADFETGWTPTDINLDGVAYGGSAGQYSSHSAPGWNELTGVDYAAGAGSKTFYDPGNVIFGAGNGNWLAFFNANGHMEQTLGATLAAGTYVLGVDVAHFGTTAGAPNQYATTKAVLIAGSTELTASSSVIPADPGGKSWATKSWTFDIADGDSLVGQTLKVGLYVGSGGGQGCLDNVALDFTPIPEPSTLMLAGMGLLGLLVCTWRKRK